MTKEVPQNTKLDIVSRTFRDRIKLLPKIGRGKIQVGSSDEATERVGRVRSKVRDSIIRLAEKSLQLDNGVEAQDEFIIPGDIVAFEIVREIGIRQEELALMSERYYNGLGVTKSQLEQAQRGYEDFESPIHDLGDKEKEEYLKRGVYRIFKGKRKYE